MDAIFKALNDPARRALLDSLRRRDGQTLTELEEQFDMTRFGVMKHLKVLEDAHLVIPRKVGRFKYHYLNPLPLQEVIDRWINPLVKDQAQALTALKIQLEGNHAMTKPDIVLSTFIDCTEDALWDALTRGELVTRHHFASSDVVGTYGKPGDEMTHRFPDGGVMLSNRVISITPKTRLELEFHPNWGGDKTVSRCLYLLETTRSGMKLTVEHYGLGTGQMGIHEGWVRALASLKTFLETGRTHRFAPEMPAAAEA